MRDFNTTVVGLDVHKDTIVAAVLPPNADRIAISTKFENQPSQLQRFVDRMRPRGSLLFVYEAGPCGYDTCRTLETLGMPCDVIAPSMTPRKPGDKVKTDRRDAEKLALLHRDGHLTTIRVPTREEEAARDLTRVREDALCDRLRARHRLAKFLLRQGRVWRERSWTIKHQQWLGAQRFDYEYLQKTFEAYMQTLEEAGARLAAMNEEVLRLAETGPYKQLVKNLRCLKGVDTLSALTLAVEVQDFRRFASARKFMGFTGLVSREDSSADRIRRGSITKVGNSHIRRVLVESSWAYVRGNLTGVTLTRRRDGSDPRVLVVARKAQMRLAQRYRHLVGKGKLPQKAVVSVARELAGFVWAIGRMNQEAMA